MLRQELKSIDSTEKVVKNFGLLLALFLAVLGGVSMWREGTAFHYLFPSAVVVLVTALVVPKALKVIYLPWMMVATIIGWTITRVILTILYYFMFTPVAILAKIFGKDFLDQKIEPEKKSYWVIRANRTIDRKTLEQQF